MAMKGYSTLHWSLKVDPYHKMQFSVIPRASPTFFREGQLSTGGYNQRILSSDVCVCARMRQCKLHKDIYFKVSLAVEIMK